MSFVSGPVRKSVSGVDGASPSPAIKKSRRSGVVGGATRGHLGRLDDLLKRTSASYNVFMHRLAQAGESDSIPSQASLEVYLIQF